MAQAVSGGSSGKTQYKAREEKLSKALVIEDVQIIERQKIVDIPVMKYTEKEVVYEKPVVKEVETIRYNMVEKETTRYKPVEKETIVYVPKPVEVEKPVVVLKTYERPVVENVSYEKPVINEKVYDITTVKDVEAVRQLIEMVERLNLELPKLKMNLDTLKEYKLVEEVITVPKLQWNTVRAERIEWVPVKREMPIQEK